MRTGKTVIGLALTTAAVIAAGAAVNASANSPASGPIHLFSYPKGSGNTGTVVIAGAIGDYGSYAAIGNGKDVKVTLSQGTFEFDTKNLNDNHKTAYKATCSGIFTGTGSASVLNGTGLYTGITGTIEVTQTHVLVASRYTTGKLKGQCDKIGNHVHHYDSISATGNVNFQ
jgi:hypothetical protein